jgi:hypothetical protein
MERFSPLIIIVVLLFLPGSGNTVEEIDSVAGETQDGYMIEQPGIITFTEGAKIKGKVDKPQVLIFLPKEKSFYKEVQLQRSFINDLLEPLPFIPIIEK